DQLHSGAHGRPVLHFAYPDNACSSFLVLVLHADDLSRFQGMLNAFDQRTLFVELLSDGELEEWFAFSVDTEDAHRQSRVGGGMYVRVHGCSSQFIHRITAFS